MKLNKKILSICLENMMHRLLNQNFPQKNYKISKQINQRATIKSNKQQTTDIIKICRYSI